MTRSPYRWPADGSPAIIKQHSIAKHEVLHAYLIDYIKTIAASPKQEALRLTLVDGFAGGGIYRHDVTRETVYGSPVQMLRATQAAAAVLNEGRPKPLQLAVDYFFVEVDPNAAAALKRTLAEQGYGARLGKDIHLLNATFQSQVSSILDFIVKKTPRKGRSIFLLDQYGYKDVPTSQIRDILDTLPAAEVVLTFNVDALLNYASDSQTTTSALAELGIPDVLKDRTVEDIKRSESDWRLYIQSCLYRGLVEACGAPYYTLFFIRTTGHGDYWLVHLSRHPRARDVMTRVHWTKNNHFIHYGGAGLDMFRVLGYSADRDASYTQQPPLFLFDDTASDASVRMLMEQLVRLIHDRPGGVLFNDLFATTCNLSPADSDRYKLALEHLVAIGEIQILTPEGAHRYKASTLSDKDRLISATQRTFHFLGPT